jgi:hypothetical protein
VKILLYQISTILFVSSFILLCLSFFLMNQPNAGLLALIAFPASLISALGIALSYPSKTKTEKICRWVTGILALLTGVFLTLGSLLADHTPGSEGGDFGILFGLPAFFLFYPLVVLSALILTCLGFFRLAKDK